MDETMLYAAKQQGMPGYCALCADRPEWKADTAKTIAEWVRDGMTVHRVSTEDGQYGLKLYAEARRQRLANKGASEA